MRQSNQSDRRWPDLRDHNLLELLSLADARMGTRIPRLESGILPVYDRGDLQSFRVDQNVVLCKITVAVHVVFGNRGFRWIMTTLPIFSVQSFWRNNTTMHGAECVRHKVVELRKDNVVDVRKTFLVSVS